MYTLGVLPVGRQYNLGLLQFKLHLYKMYVDMTLSDIYVSNALLTKSIAI